MKEQLRSQFYAQLPCFCFPLWVLLNPRTSCLKIQVDNRCNLTFLMVQYKEITADWRGPDECFISKDVLIPSENP